MKLPLDMIRKYVLLYLRLPDYNQNNIKRIVSTCAKATVTYV